MSDYSAGENHLPKLGGILELAIAGANIKQGTPLTPVRMALERAKAVSESASAALAASGDDYALYQANQKADKEYWRCVHACRAAEKVSKPASQQAGKPAEEMLLSVIFGKIA